MAQFQTTVNYQPGVANAGDFASNNPRSSVLAGASQLVVGTNGLTIGAFAWLDSTGTTATNAGTGAPNGFVGRQGNIGINSVYLSSASNAMLAGQPVTLYNAGDFWALNTGSGATALNQKVFASNTTGLIQTAAAGAIIAGYAETNWYAASVVGSGELVKISTKIV